MSTRIITPGTVASPRYGKASPVDWFSNANGTSPVWAGWVHALNGHIGRSSQGNALVDVSGNGRHLVQSGSNSSTNIGTQADGFYGQAAVWLEPPGTQADIFAAGVAGELTILQFLFHPGAAGSWFIMTPSTGTGNTARFQVQTNATYDAQSTSFYNTSFGSAVHQTPIAASRATDVFMAGATCKLDAISAFSAFGSATPTITGFSPTSTAGGAVGGPAWRIGSRSANTPLGSRCLLTVVYNRILTPAEIRLAQLGGRALLSAKALI